MKKGLIILAICLMLILSFSVSAEINIKEATCTDASNIKLELQYLCSKNCPLSSSKLKYFNEINITAKDKKENTSVLLGNFYDNNLKSFTSDYVREGIKFYFYSNDTRIKELEEYTINIHDLESNTSKVVSCPKFKYNCDLINLKINACYHQNNYLYVLFTGLGEKQSRDMNLKEDLNYLINYLILPTAGEISDPLPENYEVSNVENDQYVFKAAIKDLRDKETTSMYIDVKDCVKEIYKSSAFKRCGDLLGCLSDNDCFNNQVCNSDTGNCDFLSCDICEKASKHKCVQKCVSENICVKAICDEGKCGYEPIEGCCRSDSECDDSRVCTKDVCVNNKCVHNPVKCEASKDPCIISECIEPDGCEYSVDPSCRVTDELKDEIKELKEEVQELKKEELNIFQKFINWLKSIFD